MRILDWGWKEYEERLRRLLFFALSFINYCVVNKWTLHFLIQLYILKFVWSYIWLELRWRCHKEYLGINLCIWMGAAVAVSDLVYLFGHQWQHLMLWLICNWLLLCLLLILIIFRFRNFEAVLLRFGLLGHYHKRLIWVFWISALWIDIKVSLSSQVLYNLTLLEHVLMLCRNLWILVWRCIIRLSSSIENVKCTCRSDIDVALSMTF